MDTAEQASQTTYLTLIIPAVREAERVQATVDALVKELSAAGFPFEVLVVDDGSRERIADRLAGRHQSVRTIRFERNRGKGTALRRGFAESRGRFVIYTDDDLPYGLAGVRDCLHALESSSADAVIGDRTVPESRISVTAPLRRRVLSFLSQLVVRWLAGGVRDTQCGLKGFRGELVRTLAPRLIVDRFATDIEILHALALNRLQVQRIPVAMVNSGPSNVRLFRDAARAGWDTLRIAARGWRGGYKPPARSGVSDARCRSRRA